MEKKNDFMLLDRHEIVKIADRVEKNLNACDQDPRLATLGEIEHYLDARYLTIYGFRKLNGIYALADAALEIANWLDEMFSVIENTSDDWKVECYNAYTSEVNAMKDGKIKDCCKWFGFDGFDEYLSEVTQIMITRAAEIGDNGLVCELFGILWRSVANLAVTASLVTDYDFVYFKDDLARSEYCCENGIQHYAKRKLFVDVYNDARCGLLNAFIEHIDVFFNTVFEVTSRDKEN